MNRLGGPLILGAMLALGSPALAQDNPGQTDAILVFDASGSMWGQIDGTNKIVIARDVVANLLNDLPDNQRLGLMAYGHNRKGDCNDIEMLAPVGTDRDAIRSAVMGLNPKGMTPMTAAVQQAAEQLRFTEHKATVILVSDGEETCHADPCAAVAALEKLGVDLTVHTVGFGLESAEAQAATRQLKCIAEETGGRFHTAANARELQSALADVGSALTQTPQPPPASSIRLLATDDEGGPEIEGGLSWSIREASGGDVVYEENDVGSLRLEIAPGLKTVEVRRLSDGATASATFNPAQTLELTLPIVLDYSASLEAPTTAKAGETITVQWTGPGYDTDYISVNDPDTVSTHHSHINYTYTEKGNPLQLVMPPEEGVYEIRYVKQPGFRVLAKHTITVGAVAATLEVPATASAGETVTVRWTGPDYDSDYISVNDPDTVSTHHSHINYTYTEKGNPLQLVMPPDAGTYEVRYVQNQDFVVLAKQTINLTPVTATLSAPDRGTADSTIEVSWTGPDYPADYISINAPDVTSTHHSHVSYAYTEDGSPLTLQLPEQPGTYEIRYVQEQGFRVLAKQIIVVTAQ